MDHVSHTTAVGGYGSSLALAGFVALAMLAGALLFATPTEQQMASNDAPLPLETVIPPITHPKAP